MAQQYPLPKWGLSMEEGTVSEWHVEIGQRVTEGEVIALVATDKIEVEFESPVGGVVSQLLVAEEQAVDVGTPIIVIATDEDDHQAHLASLA